MSNPAWDKLTPLQRKLEMRRRAIVRRRNRAIRKLTAAIEAVNHRPGAGLSRVAGAE